MVRRAGRCSHRHRGRVVAARRVARHRPQHWRPAGHRHPWADPDRGIGDGRRGGPGSNGSRRSDDMSRSRRTLLGLSALGQWVWVALVVWFVFAPTAAYHFFADRWPLTVALVIAVAFGGRRLFPKLWAFVRVM